jgi:hypothetical protein
MMFIRGQRVKYERVVFTVAYEDMSARSWGEVNREETQDRSWMILLNFSTSLQLSKSRQHKCEI